ncbi:biotin/lipoyl-containing protein [Mameliella alba]|uniref:biotin/lipoyl-containing protein n=1 Tax=Mameliella alba TaxID=561184 RepID=UPI000B52E756|nr:biotin/lipoyl-containing protein [Mameliella alba]MBY6119654.1 pyruvate dehydrogenase [Mameliella alba]OWV45606.1 pyruvate dehydrogenase [Mameliella alba]OWV65651.1 pyruvate dehydrogenase [Mameliella alba]
MPHDVIMPALGMAQDSGLIVAWHKEPGEAVATGDVLFEVETDKATMEVEAQADGFLNRVRAQAGEEVPVGKVIAVIGDSAEEVTDTTPDEAAPEDTSEDTSATAAIPDGTSVIMPALGMAQDSGLIVSWHKEPGAAVTATDILFEVETDKATVEVEAGHDGYLAAILAEAGEEAPVGETIAVISAGKPAAPVRIGRAEAAGKAPSGEPRPPAPVAERPAPRPPAVPTGGRILASPKARRLALEQGLDLNRLVEAGHPQPYHAADIEVLRALPDETAVAPAQATRHLTADLPHEGFTEFAEWAAGEADLTDAQALLAGLVAASLDRESVTIRVETEARVRSYHVPAGPLGGITRVEPDTPADLTLRDLRQSRISTLALGAESHPVLTLTANAGGLTLTLECTGDALSAPQAIALLSGFAGRMEQPLRHLL